mmetsp:Transcript_1099/g.2236  ORF Transcript_1099/g.2236 Transcript_1099/m.2236 type:complete len:368 (+) Transcript_1099:29-1132(+)
MRHAAARSTGQAFELWLDCRDGDDISGSAPLSCDRRILQAGAALGNRDLSFEATGQVLDDAGCFVLCTGASAEIALHATSLVGTADWVACLGDAFTPPETMLIAAARHRTAIAVRLSSLQHLSDLDPVLARLDALIVARADQQLWNAAVMARMALGKSGTAMLETVCGGIYLSALEGLKRATVQAVDLVQGCADSITLDFIQMLRVGEGALVGSTTNALCFVHAETAAANQSARSFRIRAGPVHAYVALPDGRTKYLSDVTAGDQILVADIEKTTPKQVPSSRSVTVGRCHIEQCRVVCIRLTCNGSTSQLFLESSAAVCVHARRLPDADSNVFAPVAVTELQKGDEVLVHWSGAGSASRASLPYER